MKKVPPKVSNIEKAIEKEKVVNLNLFKIKRTLTNEGFEVIENPNGELKLIIRVPDSN